ncbi:MAG TPA: fatty acyl-AMP ligase [Acidimicrobiales bacterium]|nr:fatty acyl-AMP ligase [Acidimicrobiales bacterium]
MTSLLARLRHAATRPADIVLLTGGAEERVPWAELHEEAKAAAAGLQARGIRPDDHVAILGPTSRELVTAIQAVWLAGATLIVLPLPMRMASIEEFVAQTRARMRGADTDLLLIDHQLLPFVEPVEGDPPMVRLDEVGGDAASYRTVADDPERLVILQFTSGSTSDPKGVMIHDRTLCANLDAIVQAGELTDHDVLVSWLPLYHDMGLVGLLTVPMTTGTPLVLAAPQDFTAAPGRWMEWLATYRGTVTAGPNFSWVLAARALNRMEPLDLSCVRIALNGAEPVDPDNVAALVAAGERHGLRPGSVFPAYGMAELGIGGAFPEPLSGLRVDIVDGRVLETERYAAPVAAAAPTARPLARLGQPVPGLQMRIVDPESGQALGEREVGELEIRGSSVTSGYYKRPDATVELFHDGWMRTGDLAYLVDGELVICGRIKDVIIVGGRNVFPQDIERAVGEVPAVRAGNVIAFGTDSGRGSQHIVVVAEVKLDDAADAREVRRAISARVRATAGLSAKDVVLVSAGTLPKTSSGKVQRSLCRTRWLAGELELVHA